MYKYKATFTLVTNNIGINEVILMSTDVCVNSLVNKETIDYD